MFIFKEHIAVNLQDITKDTKEDAMSLVICISTRQDIAGILVAGTRR